MDDHPIMRAGMARAINQEPELGVCCEAGDAAEALRLVRAGRPDLVVIDIWLGQESGLKLTWELTALCPKLKVVIMSTHEEAIYEERALRAGARGYVPKTAGGEVLLKAIRAVLEGKPYVSDRMGRGLAGDVVERPAGWRSSSRRAFTDRQFQVFRLVGQGCSTQEIGKALGISPKTVDVYRQQLREKLNVPKAVRLFPYAARWAGIEYSETNLTNERNW